MLGCEAEPCNQVASTWCKHLPLQSNNPRLAVQNPLQILTRRTWPIRAKLALGLTLLILVVAILAGGSLIASMTYWRVVRSLGWRVSELPLASELNQHVSNMRLTVSEMRGFHAISMANASRDQFPFYFRIRREQYAQELNAAKETLGRYVDQLEREPRADRRMADMQSERETAQKIGSAFTKLDEAQRDDWMLDGVKIGWLDTELELLQDLTRDLPSHLHGKLTNFRNEAQGEYHAMVISAASATALAFLLFAASIVLFYRWIFMPLQKLMDGSRRVASGDFDYRIQLNTHDEIAELASAMNDMTERFQAIRDDLDRQVQERTNQVVRAERMASVGFLAAGVAHEINNPLASIAMCAESLEGRVKELLNPADENHAVIAKYLQMIQSEAFRCKGITEKLLDFSRIGQVKRQRTDLGELIRDVTSMVGHIGKYQRKSVQVSTDEPVIADVNPQEIKQVVLNLLTNALDSLDDDGHVRIELKQAGQFAEFDVIDDGCGMSQEVLARIFEPFFTRRRGGQGTGLGLSITYRIVSDHGGAIEGVSEGEGRGSTFRVRLPLAQTAENAAPVRHAA